MSEDSEHTGTTIQQVMELQYADNATLVAHIVVFMKCILYSLLSIYRAFKLQKNAQKRNFRQLINQDRSIPSFNFNEVELQTVLLFKYLSGIAASLTNKINTNVIDKINKAARTFDTLKSKIFDNHLKLATKIQVYNTVCISTLLYAAET